MEVELTAMQYIMIYKPHCIERVTILLHVVAFVYLFLIYRSVPQLCEIPGTITLI